MLRVLALLCVILPSAANAFPTTGTVRASQTVYSPATPARYAGTPTITASVVGNDVQFEANGLVLKDISWAMRIE